MQPNAEPKRRRVMSNRTFDEIENATLRTCNRCATAFNLKEDKGEEAVVRYMAKFNKRSKKQMLIMFEYIKLKGYENVKKEVMRGEHE